MVMKKTQISCCKGEYHVLVDGKYYCMAPPNIECAQVERMQVNSQKARKKFFIAHTRSPVLNAKNFLAIRITKQTDTELLSALQPLHNCTCVSFTGIKAHTFSH